MKVYPNNTTTQQQQHNNNSFSIQLVDTSAYRSVSVAFASPSISVSAFIIINPINQIAIIHHQLLASQFNLLLPLLSWSSSVLSIQFIIWFCFHHHRCESYWFNCFRFRSQWLNHTLTKTATAIICCFHYHHHRHQQWFVVSAIIIIIVSPINSIGNTAYGKKLTATSTTTSIICRVQPKMAIEMTSKQMGSERKNVNDNAHNLSFALLSVSTCCLALSRCLA